MKKIFTLFSIIFALLAGFNACGNTTNTTQDKNQNYNDSEGMGDTTYGISYSSYVTISGSIVNETLEPLENININLCKYLDLECEFMTKSKHDGKFDFSANFSGDFLRLYKVTIELVDSKNEYYSLRMDIPLECEMIEDDNSWTAGYNCVGEDNSITMKEWTGKDDADNETNDELTDDSDQI